MAEIILHHFEQSPYSEKVRVAFGLKGLAWRSVLIPRIMPKPDLMPLTGGYRKTPVMQIGADIYCDTQLILREIERRHPTPSLYPAGSAGTADALAWWADKALFGPAVTVVFSQIGDQVPQDFKDDRAKFSGRTFDPKAMKAALPVMLDQLRAHLSWLEQMLGDGRKFLFGPAPGLADLSAYHCLWFIQRNLNNPKAPPLDQFPRLLVWAERIAAIGHGKRSEMTGKEALAVAKDAKPAAATSTDAHDPAGRRPGAKVTVMPDDTGRDPVAGVLIASNPQEIVIRRSDPAVGEVAVHFPRAGFVVAPA